MPAHPLWTLFPALLILASACATWRPADVARMNGRVVPRAFGATDALMRDLWLVRVFGVLGILVGVVALVIGRDGW